MQLDAARRLLGVAPAASLADIEQAFRRRARGAHPDHGGDPAAFRELMAARAVLTPAARPGTTAYSVTSAASWPVSSAPGVPRSRLIVRRTRARRLLLALRARLPHRPAPRVR